MQQSNIRRLLQIAADRVEENPSAMVRKIVPEKHQHWLPKAAPLLSLMKLPKIETMLSEVIRKIADMPEDFFDELEYIVVGVIEGDEECEAKLLKLIGAVVDEN